MRERTLEKRLKTEIEKRGALCLKFESPGTAGVPDRLILLPGGQAVFVEMKSPTGKISEIQKYRIQQFEKLRHKVYVINSNEGIEALINELSL
ncbi:VRR-NUC domain-containing protein [Paenibacillus sp. MAH-36]|uniref:VRR-NUC domain-containing protein n=1 Tax=Paenibacillus violae TaxID=3077234 RepID=A0ABU3R7A4_9BACL|nr:VRR-NUC domain-containing protein [Paenibacillus sp. PFR10]MDU0200149.1 VRR-NUC domain-containing protein [Paenibacillus sp. PFR10]